MAVSTHVHFTSHTISKQPTKYNPKRKITITTLVDENYDNDDDDDTTRHKVQNKQIHKYSIMCKVCHILCCKWRGMQIQTMFSVTWKYLVRQCNTTDFWMTSSMTHFV